MRSTSSPFSGYSMPPGASNALSMLRRVMFRASELTKVSFSPQDAAVGLDKGKVEVIYLSAKEVGELRTQIQVAIAPEAQRSGPQTSPPTSSPSPIPSMYTHQFKLHFNTMENCKKGYALLSALRLFPRVPSPRVITGKVWGFPFTSTNTEIQQHLQQEAWYEGGCPSYKITRAMQTTTFMHGCSQPRDYCFFSVLSTEFDKALRISRINSSRLLRHDRYERSKTVVCYHCNQIGHVGKACASWDITNAAGMRDACIICGSFAHASSTCPSRDDPNATCIICKKGKHSVRACPQYRGTYKKIVTRQRTAVTATSTSAWTKPPRLVWKAKEQQQQHTEEQKHGHPQQQAQSNQQTHDREQKYQQQINTQLQKQDKTIETLLAD